jgi:hypothetical protein
MKEKFFIYKAGATRKNTNGNAVQNGVTIFYEASAKPCRHRTETGFCKNNNRTCAAMNFKISSKN